MGEVFASEDVLQRDQWGRPVIDGVAYTRASTLAGVLADSAALSKWKARHVALGVGQNPDLAHMLAGLSGDDKREVDAIIEAAGDRVGINAKANWGTAIHTLTERDTLLQAVPEDLRADVAAYREAMVRLDIRTMASERFVVCPDLQVAGTLDHIYQVEARHLPEPGGRGPHDRVAVVGDKKTGSLHPHQVAIQCAVYAHGTEYTPGEGWGRTLTHDVSQEWALLVHIPRGEGRAELQWLDIGSGWGGAQLARQVMEWRKRKDLASPWPEGTPTEATQGRDPDPLASAIGYCTTPAEVKQLWRDNRNEWTDGHTELARAAIELMAGGLVSAATPR